MVAAALTAVLACSAPGVAAAGDTTGSAGVGDTFFPKSGNGGYDVTAYKVRLDYDPRRNRFRRGTKTVVKAVSTQPAGLTRFNLDYRGPGIRSLRVFDLSDPQTVYGERFRRDGQELIVKLDELLPFDSEFGVRVRYRGRPHAITDPDGSREGWVRTDDGAAVVGEPRGTPTWMPANDHPTDKATFEVSIGVPPNHTAVSNGALEEVDTDDPEQSIYRWSEDDPMATYLATATVGKFDVLEQTGLPGNPASEYIAVDRRFDEDVGATDRNLEIIDHFELSFGSYPYDETGAIIDHAPRLGYALEVQTKPFYPSRPGNVLVSHELAHQWWGNNVTLDDWSQIWLNEGFATWAEWWWTEGDGGQSVGGQVASLCQSPGGNDHLWEPPPGSVPGPKRMFDNAVYERGGMALQALRELIGDEAFFELLETWGQANGDPHETVNTGDLIELVKTISPVPGEEIDELFDDWVFDEGKPEGCSG